MNGLQLIELVTLAGMTWCAGLALLAVISSVRSRSLPDAPDQLFRSRARGAVSIYEVGHYPTVTSRSRLAKILRRGA